MNIGGHGMEGRGGGGRGERGVCQGGSRFQMNRGKTAFIHQGGEEGGD